MALSTVPAQCTHEISGHTFTLPSRYTILKVLGAGTFGIVV
jgi:hypothetical protein